jgi:hypothetical protein
MICLNNCALGQRKCLRRVGLHQHLVVLIRFGLDPVHDEGVLPGGAIETAERIDI